MKIICVVAQLHIFTCAHFCNWSKTLKLANPLTHFKKVLIVFQGVYEL